MKIRKFIVTANIERGKEVCRNKRTFQTLLFFIFEENATGRAARATLALQAPQREQTVPHPTPDPGAPRIASGHSLPV